MTRTFSEDELIAQTGVSPERIAWMIDIGILTPDRPGVYRSGDVFRVKLVAAFLDGGFTPGDVEWAVSEGHLNLDRADEYLTAEPGPRSERTFAEFMSAAGPRASLLPAVYATLGLPGPDPSSHITTDEEERLLRFLEGWRLARSDETVIRAARLIAEGTRTATLGWVGLLEEMVRPAAERFYRGEIERFPDEYREAFVTLVRLQPRMMEWLLNRYIEQRLVANLVEALEQVSASRGVRPPPRPTTPPAVAFVDLSGYTRLTEERGDEVAVGFAATLQREAEAVAASRGGRLVKLLGDGAMLHLPDAGRGVEAALDLVRALGDQGEISAHAGVHAGPVVERDLDVFGRTVNLASRIAEAAGPREVLVTQEVVDVAADAGVRFEPADGAELKGIPGPVPLFRATREGEGGPTASR